MSWERRTRPLVRNLIHTPSWWFWTTGNWIFVKTRCLNTFTVLFLRFLHNFRFDWENNRDSIQPQFQTLKGSSKAPRRIFEVYFRCLEMWHKTLPCLQRLFSCCLLMGEKRLYSPVSEYQEKSLCKQGNKTLSLVFNILPTLNAGSATTERPSQAKLCVSCPCINWTWSTRTARKHANEQLIPRLQNIALKR